MWLVEALPKAASIKKLTSRFPGLSQSLTIMGSYLGWTLIFKVLSLTFVTYFVLSSGGGEGSHFEDVNEALGSSELALMAVAAMGFVLLTFLFQPYTLTQTEEFFTPERFETRFLPGFLQGSVLALGVTLAFLLSGHYHYLGFFIQADRAPLAIAGILIRIGAIGAFVYCEEFIFRHKILRSLTRRGGFQNVTPNGEFWHNITAVAFAAVLCTSMKFVQFDVSWMQAVTLYLISLALGIRALAASDFIPSAGFWSALLIAFHVILSLPILGHEYSGLMMIKYQAPVPEASTEFWVPDSNLGETLRWITGGAGGPLAGVAFQLLIIMDVFRNAVRYRRRLIS